MILLEIQTVAPAAKDSAHYLRDVNISFWEVVQITMAIITAIGIYWTLRLRVTKLEVATSLKIVNIENSVNIAIINIRQEIDIKISGIKSATNGFEEFYMARVKEFVQDNKEDHLEFKTLVEKITDKVNETNVAVARLQSFNKDHPNTNQSDASHS